MRVLVVDANNLVARCIMGAATSDLQAGGLWTGGIYGAWSALASTLTLFALEGSPVSGVIMAYDCGVPPARMALIPEFKSERKERRSQIPEAEQEKAFEQVTKSRDQFRRLGCVILKYNEREADDVVAAVCRVLRSVDATPVVMSTDRDLLQCCLAGAEYWNPKTKCLTPPSYFAEDVGVPTWAYVLLRSLGGDTSDSVPGVAGIGEGRALKVVKALVESGAIKEGMPVAAQVDAAVKYGADNCKDGKPVFMFNLSQAVELLRRCSAGIDLSNSFGGTIGLRRALCAPLTVDRMQVRRWAAKHSFRSVLGDPTRFIVPFEEACQRYRSVQALLETKQ